MYLTWKYLWIWTDLKFYGVYFEYWTWSVFVPWMIPFLGWWRDCFYAVTRSVRLRNNQSHPVRLSGRIRVREQFRVSGTVSQYPPQSAPLPSLAMACALCRFMIFYFQLMLLLQVICFLSTFVVSVLLVSDWSSTSWGISSSLFAVVTVKGKEPSFIFQLNWLV